MTPHSAGGKSPRLGLEPPSSWTRYTTCFGSNCCNLAPPVGAFQYTFSVQKSKNHVIYPQKAACFPEIPLFHVLNARVTFSNLCGCDEPVSSVTLHKLEGTDKAGDFFFILFFRVWCKHKIKKKISQLLNSSTTHSHRSLTPALPL